MTLVIGYGNSLRGDDGIGPVVAERIRAAADPSIVVRTMQQLLPELADDVARASRVVFVDAAVGGLAGQVSCEALRAVSSGAADHTLTPATLLDLASRVYDASPPSWLVRVEGARFEVGAPLTPAVFDAVPRAVAAVRNLVSVGSF